MPTIWPYISKIYLKNWNTIEVERNEIIVFVWANNCWKSTILKEIDSSYAKSNKTWWQKIIDKIEILNNLTDDDFNSYIKTKSQERFDESGNAWYDWVWYSIHGNVMDWDFTYRKNQIGNYHKVFSSILSTKDRLSLMDRKDKKEDWKSPTEIYHIYADNSDKFKKVKKLFLDVFWKKLSYIPQYHDTKIYFKVSDNDLLDLKYEDEWFQKAKAEYQSTWFIDEQWDWMKSFTWIISNLIAWEKNTYYIDEPESFLHPPQAYHLGQCIENLSDWQIFLATHSQDFIKWLLKTNSDRVKIYRILREGNECNLTEITKEDLSEIQNDTFLHYSNFLDSLFNHHTIICEDQSDCLFYNRVIDILLKEWNNESISINYVYSWWKWNFPKIYKLWTKWKLKFSIIWDIDTLDDLSLLKSIFWDDKISAINNDYQNLKNFIESKWHITMKWKELKEKINSEFDDDYEIKKEDKNKLLYIIDDLKKPRDFLKYSWINIFWDIIPDYFNRIMKFLKENHLFLVPFWEMESLIPEIHKKKKEFVYEAITLEDNNEKLEKTKDFLREIINQI